MRSSSMTSDTASFVQFPHPGHEHQPHEDPMPWNTGRHGRKFLRTPGRYLADDAQPHTGEVVFWGGALSYRASLAGHG